MRVCSSSSPSSSPPTPPRPTTRLLCIHSYYPQLVPASHNSPHLQQTKSLLPFLLPFKSHFISTPPPPAYSSGPGVERLRIDSLKSGVEERVEKEMKKPVNVEFLFSSVLTLQTISMVLCAPLLSFPLRSASGPRVKLISFRTLARRGLPDLNSIFSR